MKKTVVILLALILLTASFPISASAAERSVYTLGTSASATILYDAQSGAALYENNADARMLIASTTKIMTALVVLEHRELDEVVTIKPEYTKVEGSSMYLKTGEQLTIRELLYGLMLLSGNDTAVALAVSTAGSVDAFAAMMNERAQSLGCENTSFKNPHGLDAEGHFSSARDLAKIMAEAIKIPAFRDISSTKSISIAGRQMENHNKLLWSYDGMIGGKTGYTLRAGRTLVTCVERDGMTLVCVTLVDGDDWKDHTALYDWAYASFKCVRLSRGDAKYRSIPVISGQAKLVTVRPGEDFYCVVPISAEITTTVEAPRFVYAGVIRGARAGTITIRLDGEIIVQAPLVYGESVKLDESVKLTALEQLKRIIFGPSGFSG